MSALSRCFRSMEKFPIDVEDSLATGILIVILECFECVYVAVCVVVLQGVYDEVV